MLNQPTKCTLTYRIGGVIVMAFASRAEDRGSIAGRIIPKTLLTYGKWLNQRVRFCSPTNTHLNIKHMVTLQEITVDFISPIVKP